MSEFIDKVIEKQFGNDNRAIQVRAFVHALEHANQLKALDAVKQKLLGQIELEPFIIYVLPAFGLQKYSVDQNILEAIQDGTMQDRGSASNYYSVLNPKCIEKFGIPFPSILLTKLKTIDQINIVRKPSTTHGRVTGWGDSRDLTDRPKL